VKHGNWFSLYQCCLLVTKVLLNHATHVTACQHGHFLDWSLMTEPSRRWSMSQDTHHDHNYTFLSIETLLWSWMTWVKMNWRI